MKKIYTTLGMLLMSLSIFSQTNTAPTFTSTPITSVNEGDPYSYNVTTNDADGDEVSVSATTLPFWLSFTSGKVVSTFAGSGASGFADGTASSAQFSLPLGVAVDASGNVYVADYGNHRIRKITPAGVVSTLAGSTHGFADGTGGSAQFNLPVRVAVDASGNVYVADYGNHRIRKITPAGVVSTLAGSTQGFADGTGGSALFNLPVRVAVDASGNVYVADYGNHRIRKITPAGVVSTLAGSTQGFADGTGGSAQFNLPVRVAVDASGNVYVADYGNHRIRTITPAGVVSTLAGSTQGFADGTGGSALFNLPVRVAVDASGNVYVADYGNHRIRKITPAGVVSTLAGSTHGFADGTGSSAQFNNPHGVAVDASGNVYVADYSNQRIRKITPAGVVSTLAGSGISGFADGTGSSAQFNDPFGVAVDASGNVYVADFNNHRIRKITPTGVVSTLAGSTQGFADGEGSSAQFRSPTGVAVDASGNVYVSDRGNHRIRKITPTGVVSMLAGSGVSGFSDGTASSAQFNTPYGVAVDASGTVYVADAFNHRIRLISQNVLTGTPTSTEVGDHQVVLEASDGNGGTVTQSFTVTVNDITPPVFENSTPASSSITQSGFTLAVDLDEAGTAYYVVLADGATAPTAAEVKAGTASGGATAVTSGNEVVSSADFSTTVSVTGLTGNTLYDVYVVAEDAAGNLQATPSKIDITTLNTAPTFTSTPVTSVNEGDSYSYNVTTNDADGDEVSVSATTLPSWLSFNSGVAVSTLAGSTLGFADGTGSSAQFNN
ncbi:putative Ig domain-containing protein, partial [Psychroflexus aurantiacus]